jgi:hypothetical protein
MFTRKSSATVSWRWTILSPWVAQGLHSWGQRSLHQLFESLLHRYGSGCQGDLHLISHVEFVWTKFPCRYGPLRIGHSWSKTRRHRPGTLRYYKCRHYFFRSPFSDQSTAVQTQRPVFVQLLLIAFRLRQCAWLSASQRHNVESCIRTLSDMTPSRRSRIRSGQSSNFAIQLTSSTFGGQ